MSSQAEAEAETSRRPRASALRRAMYLKIVSIITLKKWKFGSTRSMFYAVIFFRSMYVVCMIVSHQDEIMIRSNYY